MNRKALFFFVVIILLIGNMIMISAQVAVTIRNYGDPARAVVVISVKMFFVAILFVIFSIFRYTIHKDLRWYYYSISIILLLLVLFFGSSGSGVDEDVRRWFKFHFVSFQPSELAKLVVIIAVAAYLDINYEKVKSFIHGVLLPVGVLAGIPAFLIFMEPDLSTAIVVISIALLMVYAAGARFVHVLYFLLIGVLIFSVLLFTGKIHKYQLNRLTSFVSHGMHDQVKRALGVAKSGGVVGKGIGVGDEKVSVPVSESDFVISIVGEEMGLLGLILLVSSYFGLSWSMINIADKVVKDRFGRFFIYGYVFWIILQVSINYGVSVGILPVTGVTLPFVSRGISSYMAYMIGLGIVLNIAYVSGKEDEV